MLHSIECYIYIHRLIEARKRKKRKKSLIYGAK